MQTRLMPTNRIPWFVVSDRLHVPAAVQSLPVEHLLDSLNIVETVTSPPQLPIMIGAAKFNSGIKLIRKQSRPITSVRGTR